MTEHYRYGYALSIPFRSFPKTVTPQTIGDMDANEARTFHMRYLVARAGGPAEWTRRFGGDRWQQPQVSQWISETSPKGIGKRLARDLEQVQGLALGYLDRIPEASGENGAVEPVSNREETTRHSPLRQIPVRGTASMGMDGYWVDLEYPAGHGDGYFEHPTSDPDAYVLRVKGDSMHPAIRSGWYVLVEPNGQVQQGEYVLVKLIDGRSTVKELLWNRNGEYALLAIASDTRLTVSDDQVEGIYPIAAVLPPSKRKL